MKYKDEKAFTDKYTREKVKKGSVLEIEPSRVLELNEKEIGFVKMTNKELKEECNKYNIEFEEKATQEELIELLLAVE